MLPVFMALQSKAYFMRAAARQLKYQVKELECLSQSNKKSLHLFIKRQRLALRYHSFCPVRRAHKAARSDPLTLILRSRLRLGPVSSHFTCPLPEDFRSFLSPPSFTDRRLSLKGLRDATFPFIAVTFLLKCCSYYKAEKPPCQRLFPTDLYLLFAYILRTLASY